MLNNLFGKKPNDKEQERDNNRNLRKTTRDIERERRKLENLEKKLEQDIHKNAADGNKDACRILAKQLIEIRKQKARTYAANSKIQSIGYQNKNITTNIALSSAMATTTKTMADMNKAMRPETIAANVRDFHQATIRMQMTEEMIEDTLDDILTESGDEEESSAVINKVLDEIGIEVSGKMATIPSTGSLDFDQQTVRKEKDIAEQLAKLRSS